MAIYKAPHAGTKIYRTRVPFNDTHRQFDMTYGEVFPVMAKFCLPGDVWKIGANALIRYKKMLSPTLTKSDAFFRFFFVPLRQVVENIEEIITGSKNGSLIESQLPECEDFITHICAKYDSGDMPNTSKSTWGKCIVRKNSFWSALGFPFARKNQYYVDDGTSGYHPGLAVQSVDEFAGMDDIPAEYWYKAYCKIIWEYFRDENYQSFDGDFDKFYDYMCCSRGAEETSGQEVFDNAWYLSNVQYRKVQHDFSCDGINYNSGTGNYDNISPSDGVDYYKLWFTDLRKDYFISSLPWIMKGVQPTINSVMHVDFSNSVNLSSNNVFYPVGAGQVYGESKLGAGSIQGTTVTTIGSSSQELLNALNNGNVVSSGFTAQDVRDMFAETRVFERLARCGSRYVEYLEANFGIAPRDDTLQRPLYLGGFRQPIVTTEVVQTGGNSDDVGTLRGHGISSYGNRIKPFVATEFGLIFGLMYVTPKTQYLFQSKRELTYKKRFDFFNPSFQLLSEQQVRSSEKFMPVARWEGVNENNQWVIKKNTVNFFTYGYQGMYNELRYDNDLVLRSLVDSEEYWTQSINPMTLKYGYKGSAPYETIPLYYENGDNTKPLNGVNICIASYLENLLKPFESQDPSFKPMIVDFVNNTTVFRPLVKDPIPSLTDHN